MRSILQFVGGIITAGLLLVFSMITGYISYGKTESLIARAQDAFEHRGTGQFARVADDFALSFETEDDMKLFQARAAGLEISDKFATDGKKSLLVEFPSGNDIPGFFFDITGKNCLNWSGLKEFSFDLYNTTKKDGVLIIRIKSGEKYPKRVFHKEIGIPANNTARVSISRDELQGMVDLSTISHLNIYMHDPSTSYKVYFDNMRVTK